MTNITLIVLMLTAALVLKLSMSRNDEVLDMTDTELDKMEN
jgi:hypothetical protein